MHEEIFMLSMIQYSINITIWQQMMCHARHSTITHPNWDIKSSIKIPEFN